MKPRSPERWAHEELIHAWWVKPRLLAGEYPGNPDDDRAREKVNVLVDAGVRTFVDLTTEHDPLTPYVTIVEQIARERDLELEHVNRPIPDLGIVEDADYDALLGLIEDAQHRGVVYVHCWGGVGRTGTVVGCLLARDGASYEEVVDQLQRLRAGTSKADRASPETDAQRAAIRRRT